MREWNDVNNFMDRERALHKTCNRILMVGVEQDETLCGCFWGLTEVLTDTE